MFLKLKGRIQHDAEYRYFMELFQNPGISLFLKNSLRESFQGLIVRRGGISVFQEDLIEVTSILASSLASEKFKDSETAQFAMLTDRVSSSVPVANNNSRSLSVGSEQIFIKLQEFQKSQFGQGDNEKLCQIMTAVSSMMSRRVDIDNYPGVQNSPCGFSGTCY